MNNQSESSIPDRLCYSPFMTDQLTFGEWLEDRLKEKRWSQSAFADQIGVARSTVSGWVNNVQPPRRRMARDIAKALGVEIDEVLVRAGYPPTEPSYRLPSEPAKPGESIDLDDPRLRFFAAHARELTEEEWEAVRRVIEELTKK